jgi:hypothetical protein
MAYLASTINHLLISNDSTADPFSFKPLFESLKGLLFVPHSTSLKSTISAILKNHFSESQLADYAMELFDGYMACNWN